jgi:hypothetical protein
VVVVQENTTANIEFVKNIATDDKCVFQAVSAEKLFKSITESKSLQNI